MSLMCNWVLIFLPQKDQLLADMVQIVTSYLNNTLDVHVCCRHP